MKRNQSLDVLRGVAIVLVLFCHYPIVRVMESGWIGVDLFFVLSGFLISGLLFSELKSSGSVSIGRFLFRRGLKIYPPFYFLLALTALLFHTLRPYWKIEAVFLQSYIIVPIVGGSMWGHLWSLAVEEHFYLFLAALIFLLIRYRRIEWIPAISAALIVLCFGLRIAYSLETGLAAMKESHLRADALFAGVALGYLYHFDREKFENIFERRYLLLLALPLLLPSLTMTVFWPATATLLSLTLLCNLIGFSLIVGWAVTRRLPHVGWLSEIGKYSYSIYLWHLVVAMFWSSHAPTLLGLIGFTVSAVAIGVAMACMVELPVLALRERFWPPTPQLTQAIPAETVLAT
jgi:peptidoglycan/LPS O-acetylase OafA/YrhL